MCSCFTESKGVEAPAAGYPPFFDEEVTQTYKKILNGKVPFPQHMSTTCRNLITSLLQVGGLGYSID